MSTDPERSAVVIIGAGAGGSAAAWRLATQGVKAVVLEAGPRFDPAADYRLDRPEWELDYFPEKPGSTGRYTFGPLQALETRWDGLRSWNEVIGRYNGEDVRRAGKYHHVRGIGGSTLHFQGEAHRLNPAAMAMHRRFGVAADWPFGYTDLEPYYEIAEEVLGVAAPAEGHRPRRRPPPLPPHAPSYASRRIMDATHGPGLRWEPNSLAVPSRPHRGRPDCNYCGGCTRGCPRTDKGSVDVSFLREAGVTGMLEIKTAATVLRIEGGPGDRVRSIVYALPEGAIRRIRPRAVILACGAIETPRLLLLSEGPGSPQGLANESGQVGQNFMETLAWQSSALHPEPLGSYRGLPSDIISWDLNDPDALDGLPGGFRVACGAATADLAGPVGYARRVVPGWGSDHKRAMRERFGRIVSIHAMGESLPGPRSRVDLDPDAADERGLPLARIHSHLPEIEVRRLAAMAERCRTLLKAAGTDAPCDEYGTYDYFSSTHVFGTCRMGTDPERSVVDPHGRSHRWRNLFVADASVFPSSGGGEAPSLTIEALAIRTADAIRAALGRREI